MTVADGSQEMGITVVAMVVGGVEVVITGGGVHHGIGIETVVVEGQGGGVLVVHQGVVGDLVPGALSSGSARKKRRDRVVLYHGVQRRLRIKR